MHIKEVHHEQVRNLGNYESARWACTVVVNEGDDPEAAARLARAFVAQRLDEAGTPLLPPSDLGPAVAAYDPGPAPDDLLESVETTTDQVFLTHERSRFRHLVGQAGKTEGQGLLFYRAQGQVPHNIADADVRILSRVNDALLPLAETVQEIRQCAAQLGQDLPTLVQSWAVTQHTPPDLGSFALGQAQALAAVLRAEVAHPGSAATILPPPSAAPAPARPTPAPARTTAANQAGGERPKAGPGPVSEKQLSAIYAIGRSAAHLTEAQINDRCQEIYKGRRPDELSKQEASAFIDQLKGSPAL